jgi:pyridoxal phosphate enzyme (YggS family)
MTTIASRLHSVQARMTAACQAAGRDPAQVKLLAVSKTFGPEAVREAWSAGQTAFGENYIQEGVEKIQALRGMPPPATAGPLAWHCIGPIQSNKTRLVAEHFDWVQSIDRLKIAQRLSEQRPSSLAPLQVCIQVNVDGGPTKSGVSPEDAPTLAAQVAALPGLRLRGLMAIPRPQADPDAQRAQFAQVRLLQERLQAQGLALDTLSMGMSDDLEAAIAEGATLVRVGSALFGPRGAAPAASA